jgi:hypothetical protein
MRKERPAKLPHQGTTFLTFSTVTTDEVRKKVESAKIRNAQSHSEEHSLNSLIFHQKMGFFITKPKTSHSPLTK